MGAVVKTDGKCPIERHNVFSELRGTGKFALNSCIGFIEPDLKYSSTLIANGAHSHI
jgi:hypothetical protein